jgi:hypothetical protein
MPRREVVLWRDMSATDLVHLDLAELAPRFLLRSDVHVLLLADEGSSMLGGYRVKDAMKW